MGSSTLHHITAKHIAMLCLALLATASRNSAAQTEALCRVFVEGGGSQNIGSATLVSVTAAGGEGLVLTCAHVIGREPSQIIVEFPGKMRHVGRLVDIDEAADLAAVAIGNPIVAPVDFSPSVGATWEVRACGFGGDGTPRCVRGDVVGQATSAGQRSIVMRGAVRSGDSGGCVLDESGRLVAVVWGQSKGMTYASAGVPLQRFVERLLPHCGPTSGRSQSGRCYSGGCQPPASQPSRSVPPSPRRPVLDRLFADRLESRLRAIEQNQAGFLTRDDLQRLVSSGDILTSPSTGLPWWLQASEKLVGFRLDRLVSTVGLMSGAGAVGFAAWWFWSRLGKRMDARRQNSVEATADADAHFHHEAAPIERDDAEARQLLRLSQLEGRDPLQDALAGRLAIDRLDTLAESDVDPKRAEWADRLRRELRERFNEVSPTKFPVVGAAS